MNKLVHKITFKTRWQRGLMLILLPFVILGSLFIYQRNKASNVYAVDPLIVTYNGNGPQLPMFVVDNMLPGDEVEKVFNVKNGGPDTLLVKMDGIKTQETLSFAGILDVEITDVLTSANLFTGKLQTYFDLQPLSLGNIGPGADKDFRVKVKFPLTAGNEYQEAKVLFNLIWTAEKGNVPTIKLTPTTKPPKHSPTPTSGPIVLPAECSSLQGVITKVIEGTNGNDNIVASNASELILGKGGNDRIFGLGGDDCIIGGGGEDTLRGGQGKDIITGGENDDDINGDDDDDTIYGNDGNDKIDGKSDDDKIYGGAGEDEIDGGVGNDYIEGNTGDDEIEGWSGNDNIYGNEDNDDIDGGQGIDLIYGGIGNDTIDGGSGTDQLFGEAGDDTIEGGSDNDSLSGGVNSDSLDGEQGKDTCTQGENNTSCEL
jgi:hypothetical protein